MIQIQPHSKRESIYLALIIILTIMFFIQFIALNATTKEYTKAYNECLANIDKYNKGYTDGFGRYIENVTTINFTNS
jgi:hypothetical protein